MWGSIIRRFSKPRGTPEYAISGVAACAGPLSDRRHARLLAISRSAHTFSTPMRQQYKLLVGFFAVQMSHTALHFDASFL
jgi:hypothetical protein